MIFNLAFGIIWGSFGGVRGSTLRFKIFVPVTVRICKKIEHGAKYGFENKIGSCCELARNMGVSELDTNWIQR